MTTPKFDRYDKVKYLKMSEVEYFLIDQKYMERPFVKIIGNPINEPHYDLKHPSIDYRGRTPKFIPESDLEPYTN